MKIPLCTATGLAACALTWMSPAAAQEQAYNIDPEHTFPTYAIEHFGVSMQQGRFNSTQGRIILNPAAKSGSAEIVVQTASIDSGLADLNRKLRGEDFFDATRYPRITYRASNVRFDGDLPVALEGQLTMHGVTQPLVLEVSGFRCTTHPLAGGKRCGAQARGTIRRSDFGISRFKPPLLGEEIQLSIVVEAVLDVSN